ncbi:MAG: DUF1015 domain-containing protein [Nitrospirae bacterium]|uniref:DUF1015 domain-containing protein n=1 Tax=Candidatus Magnetobacterium casense TaxID=1455061 RepID=UPI0012DE990A|nr:DUF1015 domain-containing protein [Candidatus Magnetobacterium casensis]MBF0337343.1 DUF1015 domain-containing protein [Nitrospirota bacterium]
MTEVIPFRGLLYDPGRVAMEDVIAPPYDIITPQRQDALYLKSRFNIARVECGKEFADDTDICNKYFRASESLKGWLTDGIIKFEDKPAFYLYETDYSVEGKQIAMRGVFAAVKLVQHGEGIYPHEMTKAKPKLDRLNLMRACCANISPIFAIYNDPDKGLDSLYDKILNTKPYFEFDDDDSIHHKCWIINAPDDVAAISANLSGNDLFIADGHHRYETALEYQRIMQQQCHLKTGTSHTQRKDYDYVMMLLVNAAEGGLTILPTHRMINLHHDGTPKDPITTLKEQFKVEHITTPALHKTDPSARYAINAAINGQPHTFGLYLHGHEGFYVLRYNGQQLHGLDATDVVLLHNVVFKQLFDVNDFGYEMDTAKTIDMVRDGQFKAAFILNPTRVEDVRLSAQTGVKMPPKSTYFYPKIPTGLVINYLQDL